MTPTDITVTSKLVMVMRLLGHVVVWVSCRVARSEGRKVAWHGSRGTERKGAIDAF